MDQIKIPELEAEQKNQIDTLYGDSSVKIANALLQAREKASLLENKIELLAISRMNDEVTNVEKTDAKGNTYTVHSVKVSASDISVMSAQKKGGGLYDRLLGAAIEMQRKVYIIADETTNQFEIKKLYEEVNYKNGVLEVQFNPSTEYLFSELKQNYSKIDLKIAFKFQTNGGLQLYKLFKTHAYKLPELDYSIPQEELPEYVIEYSLSKLRVLMGYVDLEQPDIQVEAVKRDPNYKKIEELEKKPKYKRWRDFYARVIEPGIREINSNSDIYISYMDTIKGAHGKIENIIFKFQHNKAFYQNNKHKNNKNDKKDIIDVSYQEAEKTEPGEVDIDNFIDLMDEFIKVSIKTKDKKAIAKEAGYDIEKIKAAYKVLESSHTDIESATGFLIKAIREGYENTPHKRKNNTDSAGSDTYSGMKMEDIEKSLLKHK